MSDETDVKHRANQRLDKQLLLKLLAESPVGQKSQEDTALPIDKVNELGSVAPRPSERKSGQDPTA